ncbi:Sodium/hydrogen exchanger family-domain-containing protein [Pelagophyceae sp. CCMP2097]|nr:Sodium/hydrogen exchanger family-domain-containing protein [Pelagophyceae sp. CCMP2097]|mmetsp:Transcript_6260/g.22298  ORF Transcript_6260/g.22298 Transcript_6260/m.22298 type:complete len:481 (+) Transcript_6260:198-1640(+)
MNESSGPSDARPLRGVPHTSMARYIAGLGGVYGGRGMDAIAQASKVPLPSLLGMLACGMLLRNVPGLREVVGESVDGGSSSAVRVAALSLILARAGLGLDMVSLRRLRWAALRLAAIPCLAEATCVALLSHAFFGFPPAWAALLGFAVAAVSPAVVVPSLLALQHEGYGTKTGIPTLVVAAAALDDVFSLAGFGVSLSFAIQGGKNHGLLPSALWADAVRAPLELALGLVVGRLGGSAVLRCDAAFGRLAARQRAALLALVCFAATFALKAGGFAGASALATLAIASHAAEGWGAADAKAAGAYLAAVWKEIAQPLLFSLLGVAVDVSAISAATAGYALLLLVISAACRLVATAAAVTGFGLTKHERLFVSLAWLPKATVQAAVGAVALDLATTDAEEKRARIVLAVAVIAILVTAPVGAVAIAISGPRLLSRDAPPTADDAPTDVEKPRRRDAAVAGPARDGVAGVRLAPESPPSAEPL